MAAILHPLPYYGAKGESAATQSPPLVKRRVSARPEIAVIHADANRYRTFASAQSMWSMNFSTYSALRLW